MADVKLTPEWCEAEANYYDSVREGSAPVYNRDQIVAALRLAARALRTRELIRGALDHGGDTPEVDQVLTHLLAILDGRKP